MALGDFAFNLARMQAVDYTVPVGYGRFGVLYRRHADKNLSLKGYVSVLSMRTWLICLFTYVIVASTLSFMSLFPVPGCLDDYDWRDYWHLIISVATLQGMHTMILQLRPTFQMFNLFDESRR